MNEEKQEHYEFIRQNARIIDIASAMGYHVVRKSSRYYSLQEHDSVMIDVQKNIYTRFSLALPNQSGHKGTVIDFVMEFSPGMSMHQVLNSLEKYLAVQGIVDSSLDHKSKDKCDDKIQHLILPKRAKTMKNVFAYLTIARQIDNDIILEFVKRGMLYQDERKNCVFVGYSGKKPVFATLHNTNTYRNFKLDIKGSDYSKGFYLSNGSDTIMFVESPIEVLSLMNLIKIEGKDYRKYNFLACCSVYKSMCLYYYLENFSINTVYIAFNNDPAGIEMSNVHYEKIKKDYPNIRVMKKIPKDDNDWNDVLCRLKQ